MIWFVAALALFASLVAVLAAGEARRGNPYPELRKAYRANVSAIHATLEVQPMTKTERIARIKATLKIWWVKFAIFAAFVASLVGCGNLSGEIVAMNYEPSYTTYHQVADYRRDCVTRYRTAYRTTYSGSGTSQRSSTSSYTQSYQDCRSVWVGSHAEPQFHPSCNRIAVRKNDGKIATRCISEGKYYALKVGDRYES